MKPITTTKILITCDVHKIHARVKTVSDKTLPPSAELNDKLIAQHSQR